MRPEAQKIRERFLAVGERISQAERRAGRPEGSVKLVVVTKGQPVEVAQAAVDAGARLLGENYAEEALPKMAVLAGVPGLEWHMIGHVQSRKAKLVATHFDWVHSVDSLELARRLDSMAGQSGRRMPVLLEVNIGGEQSKSGWPAWDPEQWPDLLPHFASIAGLAYLIPQGLMVMPPYTDRGEENRRYFLLAERLRDYLAERLPEARWDELSMGTSIDFEVAVEEGATYVRIGEAILGPRPKSR